MDDFFDKWNQNPKFRAGVKLTVYSVIFIFFSIFIIVSARTQNLNRVNNQSNIIDETLNDNNKNIIILSDSYTYKYSININDQNYIIDGTYENKVYNFTVIYEDVITNYKFQDNKYYKIEDDEIKEDTDFQLFEGVSIEYFSIDKINKYLEISKLENDGYRVYLKDIIYDNATDDYILFVKNDNKISVDYTKLISSFNNGVSRFSFDFEFVGKE